MIISRQSDRTHYKIPSVCSRRYYQCLVGNSCKIYVPKSVGYHFYFSKYFIWKPRAAISRFRVSPFNFYKVKSRKWKMKCFEFSFLISCFRFVAIKRRKGENAKWQLPAILLLWLECYTFYWKIYFKYEYMWWRQ